MTDEHAANRALMMLGVNPIATLDDHTKAARIMKAMLENTKRAVLNEFPWSFALRIEPLKRSGTPPAGYAYSFAYPADALSVYRVYSDTDFQGVAEFRVIGNTIAANIASGNVEYVADIQDLALWPAQLAECFVHRLASDTAVQLTGSAQLMRIMLEKYMMLARAATGTSTVEENVPPTRATDYIDARG